MITLILPEWLVWVFIALALIGSALATIDMYFKWKLQDLKNEHEELMLSLAKQCHKVSAALDACRHEREDNELQ